MRLRLWTGDAVSRNRKWKHQRKRKPAFQGEHDELISYTYVIQVELMTAFEIRCVGHRKLSLCQ